MTTQPTREQGKRNGIMVGDVRHRLAEIPDESINCCVTSPPYWGLRDYGNADQLGQEATPELFVADLVAVFREVQRALAVDGTLWLNLGDSYVGSGKGQTVNGCNDPKAKKLHGMKLQKHELIPGLKSKDLVGIPWMVAFALRADGWYLRSEIIWHKPNPMPESVQDRPTKSHEQIFLLTKSSRYFYDAKACAEPLAESTNTRLNGNGAPPKFGGAKYGDSECEEYRTKSGSSYRPQLARALELARQNNLTQAHFDAIRSAGMCDTGKAQVTQTGFGNNTAEVLALAAEAKEKLGGYYREFLSGETRNRRSVWTVASQPFSGAHFATFPPALIEPCIKAGCPEGGVVLDPFFGAGTTGLVAQRLGRDYLGVELNPDYAAMAQKRILADAPMFNECEIFAEAA